MFAWQFAKAQHSAESHGWTKFASMQNHDNLIYREEERGTIPLCLDQGVGCIPWSPLARGVLAGTRTRDGGRHTTRSSTDPFTDYLYDQPTTSMSSTPSSLSRRRVACRRRRWHWPGCSASWG